MVRTFKVVGCFKVPKRVSKVVPTNDGVYTIDMSSTSTLDITVSRELYNYFEVFHNIL